MSKINKTQTYLDPTHNNINHHEVFNHVKMNKKIWPMVTHVHGAEVRPTFDGNPLSWIDNGPK